MIISNYHRFIFLKTQKTGGTSVQLALSEICGPSDIITPISETDTLIGRGKAHQNDDIPKLWQPRLARFKYLLGFSKKAAGLLYHQHMSATEIRAHLDPHFFDSCRKITIVRNAWDREVSLYFWTIRNLKNPPTFREFVHRYVSNPDRKTFKIYSIGGRVVADTVLRYENLANDYADFVVSLGVTDIPTLPNAKSSYRTAEKQDYRSFFDKRSIEAVRKRQQREIEYFNMTFE